ncbi:MAG: hypothetical protein ABRQ23_07560 [Syntrophomonadaceae bacterium]
MIFITIGCLAFVLMLIFDINQAFWFKKSLNYFFFLGLAVLTLSIFGIIIGDYPGFYVPIALRIIFALMAGISLLLLLATLFMWLPFGKTYLRVAKEGTVIDIGMFALCRHPGVVWSFLFYLFLWLSIGENIIIGAGIMWTIANIIYVYIQDVWLFPISFKGYDQYKNDVPFLIPTRDSIYKCWEFFRTS